MAFKFLADHSRKRREAYLSHVKPEFLAWLRERTAGGRRISWAELDEVRYNSYEQELLYPHLDDEALHRMAVNCLNNSQRYDPKRPCSVYDDSAMVVFLPLLLDRLRERILNEQRPKLVYTPPFIGAEEVIRGEAITGEEGSAPA